MEKRFNVNSGKMVCSDPCYEIPTWCQGIIEGVKNGEWEAGVEKKDEGEWGIRIARLWVYNVEAVAKNPFILVKLENFIGTLLSFVGGVDSGQFGFFDYDHYRNDESAKDLPKADFGEDWSKENGDKWYLSCCSQTLGEKQWGVLPFGAVSASGYGDGSYEVVGIKDEDDLYVAFCVEFIGEDEDEEDDYEEEEF